MKITNSGASGYPNLCPPFIPLSQSSLFLSTPASVSLAVTLSVLHSEFTLITDALECVTSVCDVTDNVICEGQTKGVVLKLRIQDGGGSWFKYGSGDNEAATVLFTAGC